MDLAKKEGANRTPSGLDGRHPCCGNNRLHPSAAGNTYAIRFHPISLDGPVTFHLVTIFHPVLLFRTSHRAYQEDKCLLFYRRCLESLPAAANQNKIDLTDAALKPTKRWNPTTGLFDCTRMKKDLRTQLKNNCSRNHPLSKNLGRNLRSCRRALRPSQTPG